MAKPIFVIGTGRSGTHWVGWQLDKHPDIKTTIEEKKIFTLVTDMALDFAKQDGLYPKLVQIYKKKLFLTWKKYYADKSHPNIWLVEKLSKDFPEAKFIGIVRNPYATIASMINHKGVSAWHSRWKEFPVPNQFLGITANNSAEYDTLSLAEQCCLRWISHYKRMKEMEKRKEVLVISYEDFALQQEETLKKMQNFMGLETPFKPMEVKKESLEKWKETLTEEDVKRIGGLLEKAGVKYDQ